MPKGPTTLYVKNSFKKAHLTSIAKGGQYKLYNHIITQLEKQFLNRRQGFVITRSELM